MIERLKQLNQNLVIRSVYEPSFDKYGVVMDSVPFERYFDFLDRHTSIPASKNTYVAHDPVLAAFIGKTPSLSDFSADIPIQVGYVNGQNTKLNALEYHHSPEINVVLTPLVLMLGHTSEIVDNTYNVNRLEIFFIPERTVIKILPTTLHFSPCKVQSDGFKCGVILPYGTNMKFESLATKHSLEDHLYFKTNKWLLAHPENQPLAELGACLGIIGPNLEIRY